MVEKSQNSTLSVDFQIITYNQEDYIEEAIMSVVNQDYENLRVIVADDCSTDRTSDIIRRLAREYPDKVIPVIAETNQGITKNSNLGLHKCTADLWAWMGGDDILLPGKIKKQVDWFRHNPDGVLCGHPVYLCDYKSDITGIHSRKMKKGEGLKDWLRYGAMFSALSIMIRRNAIPSYGFDERIPIQSDWKFYIDSLKNGGTFGYVNEFLGKYRRHDSNITNSKSPMIADSITSIKLFEEELDSKWSKNLKESYAFIVLYGTGLDLMNLGHYNEALSKFKESWKMWPGNPKVYYRWFSCLFKSMFSKNAIEKTK